MLYLLLAVVLLGMIAGATALLAYHDTMETVSSFFTGPMGIGIAIAVVICVAAVAWHHLGSKKLGGASSNSKGPQEPKP